MTTEHVDGSVRITVTDSGIGIDKAFLPFVFDRFSQANTSSERRYTGLGLGLAIVRTLVELHGGTVRAESAGEGEGATFVVTLPVIAGAGDEPSSVHSGPADHQQILSGVGVFVVDDESGTRNLIQALLTQRGAVVRAFASADEALTAIEAAPPSVLVSDIAMPGQDGHAFLKKLRLRDPAQGGATPAIALTAYARSEDRVRAIESGFQMFVAKPVEATELVASVARLAGRLKTSARLRAPAPHPNAATGGRRFDDRRQPREPRCRNCSAYRQSNWRVSFLLREQRWQRAAARPRGRGTESGKVLAQSGRDVEEWPPFAACAQGTRASGGAVPSRILESLA